jgi:hypothetical protein
MYHLCTTTEFIKHAYSKTVLFYLDINTLTERRIIFMRIFHCFAPDNIFYLIQQGQLISKIKKKVT